MLQSSSGTLNVRDVPASDVTLEKATKSSGEFISRETCRTRSKMASSTVEEAKLPGGYLVTPRVPQGLAAAVEGLTREVIRNSPEDIYVFAAHHFEKLLELREECGLVGGAGGEISSNIEGRRNKTLMEMSRALRMREIDREHGKTTTNRVDQVGWSLNQTAKVLKRHRSIFGEEGRRITTDQVFLMANQKDDDSRKSPRKKTSSKKSGDAKESGAKSNDLWKASTSRTEHSLSNEDSTENVNSNNSERVRTGPKIITQMSSGNILLAKDIKTELRKNRISSRDRRNLRARQEEKNVQEKSENKVAKSSSKSWSKKPSEKQKKVESENGDKRSRKNNDSARSSRARGEYSPKNNEEKLKKRAPSMDRVKDYVIDKFATTRSIEELQSVNYVEKVQEIIDETGPIISEKIEQLKSGVMGRSERSSRFAKARGARVKGSNEESRGKEAASEISGSENSSSDALRTRLTETENLMEKVSSSLGKSLGRSRSARSLRRSIETSEVPEEESAARNSLMDTSENFDDVLEARLAKTRDFMEGISRSLSKPMRRSSSAKSLRKCQETPEDDGASKDALKKRLDETRNLLRGISASFGKSIEKSTKKTTLDSQDSTFSEDQPSSKSSLPAVRSTSLRNSSGNVSRSDSDNLVLPAISPEAPKSSKIKENLILPVLSPPGTASATEDSNKILDTNDDVPLEDFGIPEVPVEDYAPELPIENLSRDSLNVTPDFDSIPQRPDSLEPSNDLESHPLEEKPVEKTVETSLSVTNDLEAKTPENAPQETVNLATDSPDDKDVEKEIKTDLRNEISEAVDLELPTKPHEDLEEDKTTPDDLKSRLQEIQQVQKNIEEALEPKMSISPPRSEAFDIAEKLRELEDAEKRIDKIFDLENRVATGDAEKNDETQAEIVDLATGPGENVQEEKTAGKIESERANTDEVGEEKELKVLGVAGTENSSEQFENASPEVLNYTYVLTEGSPYEIPDTVTTVIIPEKRVESPLSDTLNVEIEDDTNVKLSLIPSEASRKASIEAVAEEEKYLIDTEPANEEVGQETVDREDEKLSEENSEQIEETRTKEAAESGESSPKGPTDPFGELVRPETITGIEFIQDIEGLQIPHQDLGPINEEVSEELEDLTDKQEAMETLRNVEKLEEDEREIVLEIEQIDPEKDEEDKVKTTLTTPDESKLVESDLSPEATRPNINSESSNEAKESSAIDEPLESAKFENSIDEEVSSATRTPESSNEIKETTLTDALSLSLDPTRPFVPELNLDSLQDITVSSFKITEDGFEIQERETENTNSITETLTSDENNRNNGEFVEEPVLEYPSSLPSSSRSNQIAFPEKEPILEETIVKSQVEIKEEICEKTTAYVTGPNEEEKNDQKDEIQAFETEIKTERDGVQLEESGDKNSTIAAMETAEKNVPEESKEDKVLADPNEPEKEETDEKEENTHSEETEKSPREVCEDQEIAETESKEENIEIKRENVPSEKTEEQEESVSEGSKEEEKVSPRVTPNLGTLEKAQEEETNSVDEILGSDVPEKNENAETVNSEKSETRGKNEKEPDDSFRTENSASEISNIVEKDDLSSEKEANIKSQEVVQKDEINDEKKEEINELQSKEINSQEFEEIVTQPSKEMDSKREEEEKTNSINEILGADVPEENENTETINSEKSESQEKNQKEPDDLLRTENSASEISNVVENNDLSSEKEANIKSQEVVQKDEINDERREEIDELHSKEINSQEFEGIVTQPSKEMDSKREEEEKTESPKTEEIDTENEEKVVDAIPNCELSEGKEISEESVGVKLQDTRQVVSSENLVDGMETSGQEPDDVLEESFVEEETPLAVSRSASQCTTRRVSSGNLAKLREDPTLSWTEETEREDEKIENDPSSSKVTFSGITNETTNEKASKENDAKVVSPSDVNNEIPVGQTTKDKEYHIYVPEVDASGDYSTTESSTVDSAVTKIQAGVRGFLTRRRLQRGLQNRSSTLSGIPSIQDSMAIEPDWVDDRVLEASEEKIPRPEETSISLAKSMDDNLVDAATKIQSNYRGYKARKRLRREDAVQRTTFSLEKSFAESGLQHTGEFHDCIPLPIHDITIDKKPSNSAEIPIDSKEPSDGTSERTGNGNIENPATPSPQEIGAEPSIPLDPAKMFFGNSENAPLIQFNMRPNVSQLIDLVVLAKEDAALQTGYLNFITSVEDAEPIIVAHAEAGPQNLTAEQPNSSDSLREPLALSDPPIGLVLEEVTSSIGESLTKIEEENAQTPQATNSSATGPEVVEKSSSSPTPSCPSSKVISGSMGGDQTPGDASNRSEVEEQQSEKFEVTNDSPESEEKKLEKTIANESETLIMNFTSSMGQSSIKEKEFLGPESSVDSMECPDEQTRDKIHSCSPESTNQERQDPEAKIPSTERDSLDHSNESERKDKEDSTDSNIDDSLPSKLSFSIKVEDLLDLGSEGSIDLQDKKPFLEVTLKPTDLMKSTSLSQESQLAGERIESPVTMIQIAPGRSESLKQEELSEAVDDQVKENPEKNEATEFPKIE